MPNGTFEIEAGIRVNGGTQAQKDLQVELDKLSKKSVVTTEIKLNGKSAIKEIETYVDNVKNKLYSVEKIYENIGVKSSKTGLGFTKKGAELQTYVKKVKDLNSELNKTQEITSQKFNLDGSFHKNATMLQEDGKVVTKTIDEYKQKLGEVKTVEKTFVDGKLVNSIEKVNKTMDLAKVTTERYTKTIGNVKYTFTDVKQEFANGQTVIKRTQESVDEFGTSVKQTNDYLLKADGSLELIEEGTQEVSKDLDKANVSSSKFGSSLKDSNRYLSDFVSTMGKVIKFQIITKIISGFTQAMTQSVEIVKEFDSALTEFRKVSDLSGESLDAYTSKLGELGKAVARTRTEMVNASTEFRKSGFTDEESAKLAQIAS